VFFSYTLRRISVRLVMLASLTFTIKNMQILQNLFVATAAKYIINIFIKYLG